MRASMQSCCLAVLFLIAAARAGAAETGTITGTVDQPKGVTAVAAVNFEKPEESWVKVQDELFLVLYRERLQKAEFEKKSLTLDPALGGLKLTAKQTTADVGRVALPGKEPGIKLRAGKQEK